MDDIGSPELNSAISNLSASDKQEVAEAIQRSQQQVQVNEIVHTLSATCFKKCITGKITSDALSSNEQSCARNCVSRWIDVQTSILKNLSSGQASPTPAKSGFFS